MPINTTISASLFDNDAELHPTWIEGSEIYHTREQCNRLQSIRRNRRITGNPE